MRLIDHLTVRYGSLNLIQIRVLFAVSDFPGISIQGTAELLLLPRRKVWKQIRMLSDGRGGKRKLIGMKLVEINPSTTDKRKRELSLTDAGETLREKLIPLEGVFHD